MDNSTPFNLEAEQAFLGALLVDNSVYDLTGNLIKEHHFYDDAHSLIYKYIANQLGQNKAVDAVTAHNWFKSQGSLEEIGGAGYIAFLMNMAADEIVVEDYAKLIVDFWKKRELIKVSQELTLKCLNDDGVDIDEIYSDFEAQTSNIFQATTQNEFQTAGAICTQYVKDIRKESLIGISTGFKSLDETLGDINKGYLWTVGARPAMGKSAFALSVAENVAKVGKGVFFLSMDMAQDQVATRLLSMSIKQRLEYRNLSQSRITPEAQALANEAALSLSLPMIFDHKRGRNVDEILSTIRRAKRYFNDMGAELGLVIIDHLQKIRPARTRGNDYSESTETIRKLKDGAMQLDTAFMVLCQLNRKVEERENKRPLMSDLRETGAIEEESDLISMLYRPAYYLQKDIETAKTDDERANLFLQLENAKNLLEVANPKVRQGEPKTVNFDIDIGCNLIREPMGRNYY